MTTPSTNAPFVRAFRKGLRELKVKDAPAARAQILSILGVTTKQSFAYYANGRAQTLDVEKARRIEEVFRRYGISDPWGK